jgi:hypothetical protein
MAGPTLVADYDSPPWNATTSPKTVSVTAADGDLLVVGAATENANTTVPVPTGGTGITWSLVRQVGTGGLQGYCAAYSATPPAQTYTHSMTRSATAQWGYCVARFSGSAGIGAVESTATGGSAPALNITTTQDNSGILVIDSDWNAVNGSSPTFRQINGASPVHLANGGTAGSTWWGNAYYYADAGPAGVKQVGETAPTGQAPAIIAIEILGTASGTPATFTTLVGDATAEGGPSTFTGAALFTTTAGDATAEGGSSTFAGAAVFTTLAGDASASGGVSTFSAGAGVTFTTLTGDATADGGSSTLTGAALFVTVAGDAAAAGGSSTFTGGSSSTFTTLTGDASAAGGESTFTAPGLFTTLAGGATADGGVSTFTAAVVFTTNAADATAAGGTSTFTGAAIFATTAGDATASGGVSLFLAGDIPPLPIDGVSLTVSADTRGLSVTAETRDLEVNT